jgi:catechol 2,3-dioxygenase-like lactoylglutathione lyase family enzyme
MKDRNMTAAPHLDSVYINVPDLKITLDLLRARLGLNPMLQFELAEHEHVVPIALIPIGAHTLEVLGRVAGERPAAGIIQRVEIELPIAEVTRLELIAGSELIAHPASKPDLRAITIRTPQIEVDQARLAQLLDEGQPQHAEVSHFERLHFESCPTDRQASSDIPGLAFAGWHRLSFKVPSLPTTYHSLVAQGWQTAVPPLRVLPGLSEAMFYLPSGLLIQITEEHVGTMLPVLAWQWVKSRFTRKPIQFHAR